LRCRAVILTARGIDLPLKLASPYVRAVKSAAESVWLVAARADGLTLWTGEKVECRVTGSATAAAAGKPPLSSGTHDVSWQMRVWSTDESVAHTPVLLLRTAGLAGANRYGSDLTY
jgi:hypothetical protein